MAGYNELLVGRFNRAIQKLLGMKGTKSLESINPELQATFGLFYGAENRYLEGWDRFGIGRSIPGANPFQTTIQFRNPKGSNILAVFEKLSAGNQGGAGPASLSMSTITADLTTVIVPINLSMDPRGRPNPTLIMSSAADGTGGDLNILHTAQLQANFSYEWVTFENQEVPLLPGQALRMAGGTVNTSYVFGAFWRERFLEESERT
jgi:hypothetical protein